MIEEWKDINNYEGYYKISNFGRVKSVSRVAINKHLIPERILKNRKARNGYLRTNLSKDGVLKSAAIHRLVAEAFVPNYDNKPQVNHIDENKLNNRADNLNWMTAHENNNYATNQTRAHKSHMKRVKILTDDYVEYIFDGVVLAAKYLNIDKKKLSNAARTSSSIKGFIYVGYLN